MAATAEAVIGTGIHVIAPNGIATKAIAETEVTGEIVEIVEIVEIDRVATDRRQRV